VQSRARITEVDVADVQRDVRPGARKVAQDSRSQVKSGDAGQADGESPTLSADRLTGLSDRLTYRRQDAWHVRT
jgi:hypothetical protein